MRDAKNREKNRTICKRYRERFKVGGILCAPLSLLPNGTCYNNELWPDLLIAPMNQLNKKKTHTHKLTP